MTTSLGLIVLDTLRYDTFVQEMSDVIAEAAHTFENMYSTSRWTPPAHASMFTGYYPTEVGVTAGSPHLTTSHLVLPEQLSNNGFRTIGLTENINVDPFFDFDRGFDTFIRSPDLRSRPMEGDSEFDWRSLEARIAADGVRRPIEAAFEIIKSDAPTLSTLRTGFEMFRSDWESTVTIDWAIDEAADHLGGMGDTFFFANLMTVHYPYDPPGPYAPREPLFVSPMELSLREKPVTQEEHLRHFENYCGAAQYLNEALLKLIRLEDWDLLFVVSDHGELFGEHDLRGHQYGLYPEITHVPAVAFGNSVPEGKTTSFTSLVDIHKTLLSAAGMDTEDSHRGVDLFKEHHEEPRTIYAESEGCEWYSPDATGTEAKVPPSWDEPYYMIRTEQGMLLNDKDGIRAVSPESCSKRSEVVERLKSEAERIRAERVDFTGENKSGEISESVQNQLQQLGYK